MNTVRLDSVAFGVPQSAIEKQIHKEFQDAFDALERASGQGKVDATARLNRAGPQAVRFRRLRQGADGLAAQTSRIPLAYAWEI